MRTLTQITIILALSVASAIASAGPVCRDADARAASDQAALAFFRKQGEVFRPAKVLKVHSPSRNKEVASYIQVKERHYTIFALVTPECDARFIKRTRQGAWPG